jgi:hypothetical protein
LLLAHFHRLFIRSRIGLPVPVFLIGILSSASASVIADADSEVNNPFLSRYACWDTLPRLHAYDLIARRAFLAWRTDYAFIIYLLAARSPFIIARFVARINQLTSSPPIVKFSRSQRFVDVERFSNLRASEIDERPKRGSHRLRLIARDPPPPSPLSLSPRSSPLIPHVLSRALFRFS